MKSPTAATIDSATVASTPGIVISRSTSGRARAAWPRSRSIRTSSWAWKSSCRSSALAAACSSGGSSWAASHLRPLIPNRSAAGQRGTRLRAKIACTWFFSRVRCRTICARCSTCRRSALVAASGIHTGGRKSAASSWARIAASTLSVFTFASAMARVFAGLDTTTRPARLPSTVAIAHVFPVASSATSSARPSPAANSRTPSGVVANVPACVTRPPSQIATWANSRCTSSPMHRRRVLPIGSSSLPEITSDRERVGEATPTDPRAQRNRAGRRGGHLLTRALSPPCNTGLPTLLHSRRPCPGRSHRMPGHLAPPGANSQRTGNA